jgi:acetyltransferase EpsM
MTPASKRKLAIWGASGHALVVADIVRLGTYYEVVGFLDDLSPERAGTDFCGSTVLGGVDCLESLRRKGVRDVLIAIGDWRVRLRLSEVARGHGFRLATAVHPHAVVAPGTELGAGTVIMAGAVVNPACRIGENVIINTCASVDHECIIGDGVHVCPGAHIAGRTIVERGAWVGIGATVVDGVRIGAESVIGAGAVVLRDIPAGVVAYGVPAKPMRDT